MMKPYEEELFANYAAFRLHKQLQLYLLPIIFLVGVIGNALSILILTRPAFRRVSTYTYLTAVAIADTLVLIFGLLRQWLAELTDLDPRNYADWSCKTIMVVNYTVSVYSVWLISAVTVERYLAVSRPLRVPSQCTRQRSIVVILGLFVVVLAIHLHFAWTVRVEQHVFQSNHSIETVSECRGSSSDQYFFIDEVWIWIDFLVYFLVPFIFILVLNSIIIHNVGQAIRRRGSLSGSGSEKRQPTRTKRQSSCFEEIGVNAKLTLMLVTVSFTFLILTLPLNVWLIVQKLFNFDRENFSTMSSVQLVTTIFQLLMFTNHAVNFYLYCATGHKFRQQLSLVVCSWCFSTVAWRQATGLTQPNAQFRESHPERGLLIYGGKSNEKEGGVGRLAKTTDNRNVLSLLSYRVQQTSKSSERMVAESAL